MELFLGLARTVTPTLSLSLWQTALFRETIKQANTLLVCDFVLRTNNQPNLSNFWFCRQNQRNGFASVSVQTSAPVLISHGKADPSLVTCICGVLLVMCILSFIRDRTVGGLFLHQPSCISSQRKASNKH